MKKSIRKIAVCALAVFVMLGSVFAYATTVYGDYLGSWNVHIGPGNLDFDIRPYIYYDYNIPGAISFNKLTQYIVNRGNLPVDATYFETYDYLYNKRAVAGGVMTSPVYSGDTLRVEADWHAVCIAFGYSNSSFQKNSDNHCAFSEVSAGYSYGTIGMVRSTWFASTRDDNFSY